MIYLDNSATTYPKPPAVRQAMARAMAELGANPGRGGFAMSMRAGQALFDCRQAAAKLFDARNASAFSPAAPRPSTW